MAARTYPPAEERFWAKVGDVADPDGCWLWAGARTGEGRNYGSFLPDGRRDGPRDTVRAHVFAYRLLVGPVPSGYDLHHLIEEGICTSTLCVNPRHLTALPRRSHVRRGARGFASVNAAKSECPKGHKLSGENLIVEKSGARRCRVCRRAQRRSYYERSGL